MMRLKSIKLVKMVEHFASDVGVSFLSVWMFSNVENHWKKLSQKLSLDSSLKISLRII